MFIRSKNLFMRPYWPEDRHEMLALMNEGSPVSNILALSRPLTAENTQRFIDRPCDESLPPLLVSMVAPEGAEPIGGIGLDRDGDELALGYWIAHAYRGRGFAAEAIRAVLGLARTLGHKRVIARSFVDNPAANHVLERVGFRPKVDQRWRFAKVRTGETLPKTYAFDLAQTFDLIGFDGGNGNAVMRAA